jgi:hypothetical protein
LSRDGTLAVAAFRSPPRLVLLNASSGAVVQSTETCGDADDVFFDERRRRIYVSCGSGNVAVLQGGYGGYQTIMLLPTATGREPPYSCPSSIGCSSPSGRGCWAEARRSWCCGPKTAAD